MKKEGTEGGSEGGREGGREAAPCVLARGRCLYNKRWSVAASPIKLDSRLLSPRLHQLELLFTFHEIIMPAWAVLSYTIPTAVTIRTALARALARPLISGGFILVTLVRSDHLPVAATPAAKPFDFTLSLGTDYPSSLVSTGRTRDATRISSRQ